MRKPQADEIREAVIAYSEKMIEIDNEFKEASGKISYDLVNYAYSNRLQLLNDRSITRKNDAAKELSDKLKRINIRYTIKDILFVILLLSSTAILISFFI